MVARAEASPATRSGRLSIVSRCLAAAARFAASEDFGSDSRCNFAL